MSEFYDSDGNPVEAFSQAEIDTKIEEGLKTSKEDSEKQMTEVKTKLDTLTTEKTELEEKLKGFKDDGTPKGDKELNFDKLRGMIDSKDKQIGDLSVKLQEFVDGIDVKLNTKRIDDSIALLAGGDIELNKKIRFHFNNYKLKLEDTDPIKKEENFKTRLGYAYSLAKGTDTVGVLNGSIISSGEGSISLEGKKGGKISDDSKGVGNKLGLSDDEMQKGGLI